MKVCFMTNRARKKVENIMFHLKYIKIVTVLSNYGYVFITTLK